jgi:hypothetical protein
VARTGIGILPVPPPRFYCYLWLDWDRLGCRTSYCRAPWRKEMTGYDSHLGSRSSQSTLQPARIILWAFKASHCDLSYPRGHFLVLFRQAVAPPPTLPAGMSSWKCSASVGSRACWQILAQEMEWSSEAPGTSERQKTKVHGLEVKSSQGSQGPQSIQDPIYGRKLGETWKLQATAHHLILLFVFKKLVWTLFTIISLCQRANLNSVKAGA